MAHPMEQEYSIIDAPALALPGDDWDSATVSSLGIESLDQAEPSVMRRRKELVDLLFLGNLSWFPSSTLKSKFAS